MHHLIDPTTGRSAVTDLDSVTTVGPTLWWAEAVAKVALMRGSTSGRELLEDLGMSGVLVGRDAAQRYEVVSSGVVAA